MRNGKIRIKLAALLVYTGLYIHDMLRGDLIFFKYEKKMYKFKKILWYWCILYKHENIVVLNLFYGDKFFY